MFQIVLYLDGSEAARRAVTYLSPLAQMEQIQFTLLVDQAHETQAEALFTAAETILAAVNPIIRSVRGSSPERAIALEARASQPDLVVFGPLSPHGWQRWLGQSSVRSLARRLTTSMLLMRGRPNELHRALLCAAGGKQILRDAELTAALLGPLKAQATILHIVSQLPLMFNRPTDPEAISAELLHQHSRVRQNLEQAQKILEDAGVETKIRIRVGMVLTGINDEIRGGGYDLLVLGAHSTTTPLDRVLLEDMSGQLLLDSPIPVLLVQNTTKDGL